jgi:hypothetical protein
MVVVVAVAERVISYLPVFLIYKERLHTQ